MTTHVSSRLASDDGNLVRHEHAPPHLYRAGATYFVTAKTCDDAWIIGTDARKQQLIDALHFAARQRGWRCIAWVALSNHYHALLVAPTSGEPAIGRLISAVHRFSAVLWNREESTPKRQVWYQYWDTCITSDGSFWARVNYIHWNPVKHGVTSAPEEYAFSSYRHWAEAEANLYEIEASYPWDRLALD